MLDFLQSDLFNWPYIFIGLGAFVVVGGLGYLAYIFIIKRREKRSMEIMGIPADNSQPPNAQQSVAKYKALVLSLVGGRVKGKFQLIAEDFGGRWRLEPSMPTGNTAVSTSVVLSKDGKHISWDPRAVDFDSQSTPGRAYRATHWEIVGKIFVWSTESWQKVNMIIYGIVCVGFIILALVALDKISPPA